LSRTGTIVAAALTGALAAAVPAVAHGWSIHRYSVRDAGPTIVHKVSVCDGAPRGLERKFWFTGYSEAGDGSDAGQVRQYQWVGAGCWRIVVEHDDDLQFEGVYYGRMKVRNAYTGAVRWTGWREFWSS
jgi:hypothetical protein